MSTACVTLLTSLKHHQLRYPNSTKPGADHGAVDEFSVTDERVAYAGLHEGASYLEHLDFLDAIRNGTPPKVTLEDGLRAVAIGVAAQRSIEEHRPVSWAEVVG